MEERKEQQVSILHSKKLVSYGDNVVLWAGREYLYLIEIIQGSETNNKLGCFKHDEIVGKPFGTKWYSKGNKGWIYILQPSAELWTRALKLRTQILYTLDISMIIFYLELKPGMIVAEAGLKRK